jgi:hypothetical protein
MTSRIGLGIATLLTTGALAVQEPVAPRSLNFEERVAAQRAIEQVYWSHRIWPKENPGRSRRYRR